MHVLVLPKWYPGRNDPQLGDFIRKQMLAAATLHRISVVFPCQERHLPVRYQEVLHQPDGAFELCCYYRPCTSVILPLRKLINFVRYRNAMRSGVARVLKERGVPDLVHAHILTRPAFAAWRMAGRWGVPFIISEQSSGFLNGSWEKQFAAAKALDRFLVRRARKLLSVSPHLANALQKLRPQNPIAVVPNVLPLNDDDNVSAGPAGDFLMVADLVDRIKNVSGVLRALKVALGHGQDLHLQVIGDGPDRNMLEQLAASLDITAHVTWSGKLPNSEVLAIMAGAGTVIINSPVETFSVVTGEALSFGKPVIATRCGGPEAFITPENGVLIPPGDDQALAHAMVDMAARHGQYAPEKIRASVGERFSKAAVAAQLDAIYKEVVGHG